MARDGPKSLWIVPSVKTSLIATQRTASIPLARAKPTNRSDNAERFGRLRSYVRPGGAAHMSAGPDEVRRPGIPIRFASSSSCLTTGCFWSSVATVSFIAFQCACQTSNCDLCNCSVDMLADMLAGRAASLRLRGYFGAEDFAGPHYRPDDPGELVGQRHRDAASRLFRQKRAEPAGERAFALAHATQQ